MAVKFRLLGEVQAFSDSRPVDIGYAQLKCVLAVLLVEADRTVSVDDLVDRVWGSRRLPRRPRSAVQHSVTLLRRALAGARDVTIVWRSTGYQLNSAPETVDVHRFRTLVNHARGTDDDAAAAATFEQALALWRGEPFAGLDTPWLNATRNGLVQQRREAQLDLVDIDLRRGRHSALIPDLREWTGHDPLDERLAGQYLIALYRSGRQAHALEHYEHVRRCLAEQLGADPSAALQLLHHQILCADPALAVPTAVSAPAVAVPPGTAVAQVRVTCTLPIDVAGFVGRARQVRDITTMAAAAAHAGRAAVVCTIDGMPGIGKTALAVHVAHLMTEHFPDRQLFLDLHAHTAGQQPTTPFDALGSLLAADGLDPRYMPDTLDQRAAVWRDRMSGQRAVLVLDNAASTEQVAALLPGLAGCLVLITSRRHLGDLPSAATAVPLDVLGPAEAEQMFVRLAPRAAEEPARVAELAAMCGSLPLAISLLARLFNKHRAWSMTDLITETAAKLLTVTAEHRTIAAAFDLSYQHLSVSEQRFLRHLGLHPGVDIEPNAAAALADLPLDETVRHLDALHGNHLVNEPEFRRYRMHDLIRVYARTLAAGDSVDEREGAVERLLDFYQHTAAVGDGHLAWHTRPPVSTARRPPWAPRLSTWDKSLSWMRVEHANLLACVKYATVHHQHARVVGLAAAIASYLRTDGPWSLAADLHRAAAVSAWHLGDAAGHATALHDLGEVLYLAGDHAGAIVALRQALDIRRDLGNRRGEAQVRCALGVVGWLTGDHSGAEALLRQAREVHRDVGNPLDLAGDLHNLGIVAWLTGAYTSATQRLQQALDIYRDNGNRRGEASSLNELGAVCVLTGDYSGAEAALRQALETYLEIGDRRGQANALNELGALLTLTGDHPGAEAALRQALETYLDIGDQDGAAESLNNTGRSLLNRGCPHQARTHHQRAFELARTTRNRLAEARALEGTGRAALATDDARAAAGYLAHALAIYKRIGAAEADRLAAELDSTIVDRELA